MSTYIPFDNRAVAGEDDDCEGWLPSAEVSANILEVPATVGEKPARPPLPLEMDYPCVVCGGCVRWDHQGIWRCTACWPPSAFGRQREGA